MALGTRRAYASVWQFRLKHKPSGTAERLNLSIDYCTAAIMHYLFLCETFRTCCWWEWLTACKSDTPEGYKWSLSHLDGGTLLPLARIPGLPMKMQLKFSPLRYLSIACWPQHTDTGTGYRSRGKGIIGRFDQSSLLEGFSIRSLNKHDPKFLEVHSQKSW